jgi:hypothetical protein
MLVGLAALVLATLFAGAALYISLVEHPARMTIADGPLLAQWKLSYKRALPLQAGLAVLGGVAGLAAGVMLKDWRWLFGGVVLLANWPVTLVAIMPVNKALMATPPDGAGPQSRAMLERWGRLHDVRSALGTIAVLLFLCGLVADWGAQ